MTSIQIDPTSKRFMVDEREVYPASVLSTSLLLWALEQAQPYARGKLLDVGCGTKPYHGFFEVEEHIGIDWKHSPHQTAADYVGDIHTLFFEDSTFDTVLCTEVIEHLEDPFQAVGEMARVLRPGGYLILSAPFVHQLHEAPHDFYRYTALGLAHLIRQAGLTPVLSIPRGGPSVVMLDLSFRMGLRITKAVLRRVPLGRRIEGLIVRAFIIWPQQWVARFLKKNPGTSNDNTHNILLTLGHVVVARKPHVGEETGVAP